MNKSFLSPYNQNVTYTPHLEQFSREGHVFTKHRTEASLSGVAFASIFSGSQAMHHGVFTHPGEIPDSIELISEAFADNGYTSFFWGNHRMASADLGYAQGVASDHVVESALRGGDARFHEILHTLRTQPEFKAFVATAFTETHAPYRDRRKDFCSKYPAECAGIKNLSEERLGRHLRLFREGHRRFQMNLPGAAERFGLSPEDITSLAQALDVLYRSNVEHLDRMFGNVIREIREAGLLDDTVVVFTADHGEAMYDPKDDFHWSHAFALQAEALDVPLIIWGPGRVPPGRADFVTRSIDVFPTLGGLARLTLRREMRPIGFDLSHVLRGEEPAPSLIAFSHNSIVRAQYLKRHADEVGRLLDFFTGDSIQETWVALREGDTVLKYRHAGAGEWRFEAYNLIDDPSENHNVYDPANARHRSLTEKLKRYKADLVESYAQWEARRGPQEELSEEDLRRLRSLGYVR